MKHNMQIERIDFEDDAVAKVLVKSILSEAVYERSYENLPNFLKNQVAEQCAEIPIEIEKPFCLGCFVNKKLPASDFYQLRDAEFTINPSKTKQEKPLIKTCLRKYRLSYDGRNFVAVDPETRRAVWMGTTSWRKVSDAVQEAFGDIVKEVETVGRLVWRFNEMSYRFEVAL